MVVRRGDVLTLEGGCEDDRKYSGNGWLVRADGMRSVCPIIIKTDCFYALGPLASRLPPLLASDSEASGGDRAARRCFTMIRDGVF